MALPQDGQNANGLTKVTEIPKGKELIFIDPTTNEGGIITLEDLTTQILKNLTSQTFALDQGTKTLPAALNELNSKAVIRDRLASVDGTGKVKIPYDTEGVALINVSSYNPPSTVEQSLYIVGMAKSYTEVRFDKIFGEKDYIKIITQSGGFLNFTFNQKNALCRIVFIGN